MSSNHTYSCPHCQANLNQGNEVVLTVQRYNNEQATIYLNPLPGIYEFRCRPYLEFEEEEIVNFFCPHCASNLTSKNYHNYAELKLKVSDGLFSDVIFSRIYDDQKTHVITEDFKDQSQQAS